ncbi:unnamed protein product [Parajaminaea phylloscopi]
MTLVDGDEMHRLWTLVVDLSAQLNMNRQNLANVQTQLENLKAHSVHAHTGFALRRFNVDVSKEKFESELERLNVHLITENNDLRWENRMNDRLIKEYEQCLEVVMKKFRSFSHATQTHTLRLTQHYEDLLASTSHETAVESLDSATMLSESLTHLGHLVRSALREIEGEGTTSDDDERSHEDAESSRRFLGSGGYTGKAGDKVSQRADQALEREAELQSLRYENETLREILGMAEGKGLDVGAGKEKLSLGTPRGGSSGTNRRLKGTNLQEQLYPPIQQQQQQQQQPQVGTPDLPAIPSAPFPSASAAAPGQSPTPPPTPPSQPRVPFHERMQQAAESIRASGMSASLLSRSSLNQSFPISSRDPQLDGDASARSSAPVSLWPLTSQQQQQQQQQPPQSSVLVAPPPGSDAAQDAEQTPSSAAAASETQVGGPTQSGATASTSSVVAPTEDGSMTAGHLAGYDMDELAAEEAIDLTEEEGEPVPVTGNRSAAPVRSVISQAPIGPPSEPSEATESLLEPPEAEASTEAGSSESSSESAHHASASASAQDTDVSLGQTETETPAGDDDTTDAAPSEEDSPADEQADASTESSAQEGIETAVVESSEGSEGDAPVS